LAEPKVEQRVASLDRLAAQRDHALIDVTFQAVPAARRGQLGGELRNLRRSVCADEELTVVRVELKARAGYCRHLDGAAGAQAGRGGCPGLDVAPGGGAFQLQGASCPRLLPPPPPGVCG